jgi:hypothetical protein
MRDPLEFMSKMQNPARAKRQSDNLFSRINAAPPKPVHAAPPAESQPKPVTQSPPPNG